MAFTVVGLFKNDYNVDNVSAKLRTAGFVDKDIDVSPYRANYADGHLTDNDYYDYEEDENTGGFWDWLFGDDEYDRKAYSTVGSYANVITVHTANRAEAERAAKILDEAGAINVKEDVQEFMSRNEIVADADLVDGDSIKVVKEQMNVGKRTVETGGVRVRSRIIEKPVEESLRLRNERVYVKRKAVNRPATEADFNTFKEGTIEAVEHAEVAVAEKKARVVEEITVGKEVDHEVETVSDTVRETEVIVEDIHTDVDVDIKRDRNLRS